MSDLCLNSRSTWRSFTRHEAWVPDLDDEERRAVLGAVREQVESWHRRALEDFLRVYRDGLVARADAELEREHCRPFRQAAAELAGVATKLGEAVPVPSAPAHLSTLEPVDVIGLIDRIRSTTMQSEKQKRLFDDLKALLERLKE